MPARAARESSRARSVLAAAFLTLASGCASGGDERSLRASAPDVITATVAIAAKGERMVELRVLHPRCAPGQRYPLLLFSQGANSAPAKYDRLTSGWAARGFVVAAPLHADSPDHAGGGKIDQARSWSYRIEDMRLPIDQAVALETKTGCRIDVARVAATGHSYGALIAQALGGARLQGRPEARDPRVRAIVAFSPPGPVPGYIGAESWSSVAVPMFVQTGTADVLPMIAPRWESHLVSYEASRAPGVLLVGARVDHYFGNIIGRPERAPPSEDVGRAFQAALATSTDFLRSALDGDRHASRRLEPAAVRTRYPRNVVARYERR